MSALRVSNCEFDSCDFTKCNLSNAQFKKVEFTGGIMMRLVFYEVSLVFGVNIVCTALFLKFDEPHRFY